MSAFQRFSVWLGQDFSVSAFQRVSIWLGKSFSFYRPSSVPSVAKIEAFPRATRQNWL